MIRNVICAAIFFVLCVSVNVYAGCPIYPTADGYDVVIPDSFVGAIPGYDPSEPVYVACDNNGWFVRQGSWASDSRKKQSMLTKKDGCWVAPGVKGARFNIVQLTSNGEPIWAKIEDAFPLNLPFINHADPKGPAILVK